MLFRCNSCKTLLQAFPWHFSHFFPLFLPLHQNALHSSLFFHVFTSGISWALCHFVLMFSFLNLSLSCTSLNYYLQSNYSQCYSRNMKKAFLFFFFLLYYRDSQSYQSNSVVIKGTITPQTLCIYTYESPDYCLALPNVWRNSLINEASQISSVYYHPLFLHHSLLSFDVSYYIKKSCNFLKPRLILLLC